MFSLQKIAVFVIIIAVIWLGFRFVGNLEKQRKAQEKLARPSWRERFRRSRNKPARASTKARPKGPASEVEVVPCKVCGDYVAVAGTAACGRPDCPYPPAA
ncbi:MAG: hypothetical protein P8Q36_14370 [Alphaproteobacteria bacterium]|jgi:hypothetical protein|nr:hypothetical protein [Rhodospirillaceae bacterium]MBT6511786.1 hypothetical protein [Rhodospirillaceae bacterium]MDG2482031.1 hypothetical protein [Alphaproteobacteria bacterium]